MRAYILHIVWCLSLLVLVEGCSTTNPRIEHGDRFQAGPSSGTFEDHVDEPQAQVNAVLFINTDQQPVVQIAADIVCNSLVFTPDTSSISNAIARLALRLKLKGPSDTTVYRRLELPRYQCGTTFTYVQRLRMPPGDYRVRWRLTDRATGKSTIRQVRTTFSRSDYGTIAAGNVRMEIKQRSGPWHPQAGYDVQSRYDSLKFNVRISNDSTGGALDIRARLLKFRTDTSVTRKIYGHKYRPSSLAFQGIDYNQQKVIYRNHRVLFQPGGVEISFRISRPRRGNYRFEVRAGSLEVMKARDFAIRSQNFPVIQTPREQAAPLIYLMVNTRVSLNTKMEKILTTSNPKSVQVALKHLMQSQYHSFKSSTEYEKMLAISDSHSQQKTVNEFWKHHIGNAEKARKVAALYYQRVQAANERFTNYKEGWKTDRGRLYILYGPPSYTFHWSYHGRGVPPRILRPVYGGADRIAWVWLNDYGANKHGFSFFQPRRKSANFPFTQFLKYRPLDDLLRYKVETKMIQRQGKLWLSGRILKQKIDFPSPVTF